MNIHDFEKRKWVVLGANCYPLYADSFAMKCWVSLVKIFSNGFMMTHNS